MGKQFKSFPSFVTKLDAEQGIVEHIITVFGIVDYGDDRAMPGMFKKTITECGNKVLVLDAHNSRSTRDIVGKPVLLREVGRDELPAQILAEYPEATGGLWARTQFLLNTPEGKGVFERLKADAVREWSYGYAPLQVRDLHEEVDGKERLVRELLEVKLYEYSPVLWGMNPATATLNAKGDSQRKEVPPYQAEVPLGDRNAAWDAAAVVERVRDWAGGEDDIDWERYRQAFFWYDADNAENLTAYKLPYCDVVDDELTAMPRGIFAAAGGRGVEAADIPDADKEEIKEQMTRWYERMAEEFEDDSIVSPFANMGRGEGEYKAVNYTQLTHRIEHAFWYWLDNQPNSTMYIDAIPEEVFDEYIIVKWYNAPYEHGFEHFQVGYTIEDDTINFAPLEEWVGGGYVFVLGQKSKAREIIELKVGRRFSRESKEQFLQLAELIRDTVGKLVELVEPAEGDKAEPPPLEALTLRLMEIELLENELKLMED